jgi:DNA-directed RNA polymerase specialized sigma24 family protein
MSLRRDPVAFRRVVEEQGPRLTRLAHRLVDDAGLAEDVVQEVFARLYRAFGRVRDPRAWLTRATLNRAFDELRRRARDARLRPPRQAAPPGDEAVRAAAARLPRKLRSAVILVYVEEMTAEEAAQALGCTANAIRQRLYAAREKLRGVLEKGDNHDVAACAPAGR